MSKTKYSLLIVLLFLGAFVSILPAPKVKAQTYTVHIAGYDNTESVEVNVDFSIDGIAHDTTPHDESGLAGDHYLNVDENDTYGHNFQGWLFLGNMYIENTFWLNDWMDQTTVTAIYESGPSPPSGTGGTGNYTFYGLNSEDTGLYLGSVYVTVYYNIPNTYPERFLVAGQYGYNTTIQPLYFYYDLDNDTTENTLRREYWLSENEANGTYPVLNSTSLSNIVITFRDLTGALASYDLVSAKRYINGTLMTVDKRRIDVTKRTVLLAVANTLYTIIVSDGTSYTFGDVNMLYTEIELTLKGYEFPQTVILANQYIRFWAYRNFTANTIIVNYQDTELATNSVVFTLRLTNGTVKYTSTHTGENSFIDTWTSAVDNETYYCSATINCTHGIITESITLQGIYGTASPWSFEFLGSFPSGIDTSQLIPAIAILFVFGLFSVLNAYLGAFFGAVLAAFFAYMGWLNINGGVVVAALAFAIFLGITFAKRRLLT